jgi:Glutamate-1-semialdehyde aminotransferase
MNPIDQNLFLYHLRDNGIMVSEVGNNFLSTAHTEEDIEKIIEAVGQSVLNMKSGGYFEI